MAEIKSAIELAMERTKNLVMDQKEREESARRDLEDRLKAVIRRYMEGIVDREAFLSEYGQIKPQTPEKRNMLTDLVVEEFEVSAEKERLFDILEMAGEEVGDRFANEAKTLKIQFDKELQARRAGIKDRIRERLEAMGIGGTAVEPNAPEWPEWKESVQEIAGLFKKRLCEWKDRVRTVSS